MTKNKYEHLLGKKFYIETSLGTVYGKISLVEFNNCSKFIMPVIDKLGNDILKKLYKFGQCDISSVNEAWLVVILDDCYYGFPEYKMIFYEE